MMLAQMAMHMEEEKVVTSHTMDKTTLNEVKIKM